MVKWLRSSFWATGPGFGPSSAVDGSCPFTGAGPCGSTPGQLGACVGNVERKGTKATATERRTFEHDFLQAIVQEVVRKYEILFIADEVITAFGRLGTMFGSGMFNIKSD